MRKLLTGVLLLASSLAPLLAETKQDSCDEDNPFQLQEQLQKQSKEQLQASLSAKLCQGIVDSSFGRDSDAEKELRWVNQRAPRTDSSNQAHESLLWMYLREGRYSKADAELKDQFKENPSAKDVLGELKSLLDALARNPEQTVAAESQPSTVSGETNVTENNLFLPFTVNGLAGSYILDSGANLSVIAKPEADRLGLKVESTTTRLLDINGIAGENPIGIAVAPDLWIGKTHLQNVAFYVVSGESPALDKLPYDHKGLLGISVLIALRSFRIDTQDHVQIQAVPSSVSTPFPLAFAKGGVVIQTPLSGKMESFTLDTGANQTQLFAFFATKFPDLMSTAGKENCEVVGLSVKKEEDCTVLPSVKFSLGREVALAHVPVLRTPTTDASNWAAGNLGFDLLRKTTPVTVDFKNMQLLVETADITSKPN
jgi:hypothetical protein